MAFTTPESSRQRIPVMTSGNISLPATALERIDTRMYHLGRVDGVRETCELLDELVFDREGDTLAAIAPALAGMGASVAEVGNA